MRAAYFCVVLFLAGLPSARDIEMPSASCLVLTPLGVDAAGVRAYWWHDSFGWQRFSSLQPWISLSGFQPMFVKLEVDGFLPIIQDLKLPRVNAVKNEKPPPEVPAEFHFEGT
jgi:hypothetical protein